MGSTIGGEDDPLGQGLGVEWWTEGSGESNQTLPNLHVSSTVVLS